MIAPALVSRCGLGRTFAARCGHGRTCADGCGLGRICSEERKNIGAIEIKLGAPAPGYFYLAHSRS